MGSVPPTWTSTLPEVKYQSNTSATPSLGSATKPSSDIDMRATTFDVAGSLGEGAIFSWVGSKTNFVRSKTRRMRNRIQDNYCAFYCSVRRRRVAACRWLSARWLLLFYRALALAVLED